MNTDRKFKRSAKLLEDGMIEINVDAKTQVIRKVRESDFKDWPDLEKPKPKRGRKKRVKADGDDQESTESSTT